MTKLIAFDQSTTATGWCVIDYETGEILDYGLIQITSGKLNNRIRYMAKEVLKLCDEHEVSIVFIEGIHSQSNAVTFEALAKLQGVLEIAMEEKGLIPNVVKAVEWRKRAGIKSRRRADIKQEIIDRVEEEHGIRASEDECEAIMFALAYQKSSK